MKSLYDNDQNVDDEDDDMECNEDDDTEGEDPNVCDDDPVDDRLSEPEDQECERKPPTNVQQYPVLNISEATDLPEFNIEVNIFPTNRPPSLNFIKIHFNRKFNLRRSTAVFTKN